MSVRQYIGARYVPKFDGTWDITKTYEPLTIVDDANGNSYTSKKDVPAGVELTDREYWALTGSLSGAITSLQNRMSDVESAMISVESDVQDVKNEIDENVVMHRYGNIEYKKYQYDGYAIMVTKIKGQNANGSLNRPKAVASVQLKPMHELVKGKTLSANAGFMKNNVLCDFAICDGQVVRSSETFGSAACMVGIDNDGEFRYYYQPLDADAILGDGCLNAVECWCPLVENGAVSARVKQESDTTQQNIAYDASGNYYIITTSYFCPLSWRQVAEWIVSHIPGVKGACSLDGGGSTQTMLDGVRLNLNSDLNYADGRPIGAAIVFDALSDSTDFEAVAGRLQMLQDVMSVETIYQTTNIDVNEHLKILELRVYKQGNRVDVNIVLEVQKTYAGGWFDLTPYVPKMPNPVFNSFGALMCTYYSGVANGRCNVSRVYNGTQTEPFGQLWARVNSLAAEASVLTAATFEANFSYYTQQMH